MGKGTKKEETISQVGFAKLCGVKPQAISKAKAAGKLDLIPKGKRELVNLSGEKTQEYLKDNNYQRGDRNEFIFVPGTKKDSGDDMSGTGESRGSGSFNENNFKASDFEDPNFDISKASTGDVGKYQKLQQALKNAQERKKNRGELVERSLIKKAFGILYAIEQNQLKPIADKAPSEIAGIYGDDGNDKKIKVTQLLHSDIMDVLTHISIEFEKFIKSLSEESFSETEKTEEANA